MELPYKRRIGRRQQCLACRVHYAVCQDEKPDAGRKAGSENANGEEKRAKDNHPLAAEEIRKDAAKRNGESESERERASHDAKLGVGDSRAREVGLYLRKHGIEYLPRPLRQEVCRGD